MIKNNTFKGFPKEGINFLKDLKQNNNREWFADNKTIFKDSLEAPAKEFADQMTQALNALSGNQISSKVFRIYRDMRFSKDKTPYKTHLHISFMRDDLRKGKGAYPAFHFSFEPGRLTLGLGNFEFARDILDNYQYAILEDKAGEELQEIVKDMEKKGFRISEPKYKKIPLRFDANHPRAELLRHKGFIVWSDEKSPREISEPKLINYCLKRFEEMLPVYKWLGDLENF